MKTDQYGQITISEDEAVEALYRGISINSLILENPETIDQFNQSIDQNKDKINYLKLPKQLNINIDLFDKANQSHWFMPEEYKNFPIVHWLTLQCRTEEQLKRVDEEIKLFIQHGMFDLLFYLKYLVDTLKSNKILWGVGRGSSVSSYVLYLLGVHKIDSIKYELDINEFLK